MNAARRAAALAAVIAAAASCRGGDDRAVAPAVAEASGAPASDAGATAASPIDAGLAAASGAPAGGASYRAALEHGRRLVGARDWRGGAAAFEEALAARPGDARALSELGWAAFRAGDLDRAAQASRDAAVAAGASVRVRAAALYNLGRVDEARGDKDGAAEAYRASLVLHASRAVKRHLRAIAKAGARAGSVAAAVADVEIAAASDDAGAGVVGPFASIDAYCDAQVAHEDDDDGGGRLCAGGSGLAAGVDHATGPPEVKVVGVRGELDDVTCLLALHARDGWYLWDGVPCATSTAAGTDWAAAIALDTPAPGRVVARFAIGVAVRDGARGHHACEELAVACVVDGPKPGCTAAAPIAWAASCADAPSGAAAPSITWDAAASWSIDRDVLAITPPTPARAAPAGLADLAAARLPLRP